MSKPRETITLKGQRLATEKAIEPPEFKPASIEEKWQSVTVAHSPAPAHVINEQRAQFLERFSECGSVLQACNDTGVPRRTHYHWLSEDPEYKAAFEVAKQQAVDALEARVFQRANVESDRLAEFLLKGLRPQIYGDRFKAEHSGPDGKPMETETTLRITFDGK